MTEREFLTREQLMADFMDWLQNTVHSVVEMNSGEYTTIFNKIKPKAKWKKTKTLQ